MIVSTIQFSENIPSDSAAFSNAFARPNVKRTAMQNRASCCSRAVHYFPVLLPTSGDAILVPNQLNQPENRRPDNNCRLTRVFQSSPLPFFFQVQIFVSRDHRPIPTALASCEGGVTKFAAREPGTKMQRIKPSRMHT